MIPGRQHLDSLLRRMSLDAILFSSLENIRYLSGFTGSDGTLVYTAGEKILLSDSRYEEQAKAELRETVFLKYRKKIDGIARCLRSLRAGKIGFEAPILSWESHRQLKALLPRASLVPLAGQIAGLRARKDPEEVARTRRAIQIASDSFLDIRSRLKAGVREKTIGDFLEFRMNRRGGQGSSFPPIVVSGTRSALPHGKPSLKKVNRKDLVVIDFGVRHEGYHSDETKTLIVGKPDPEVKKIYDLVRRAQEKAFRAVRPGESVRRIDAAAREVISRGGFGKFFGHGTGHGIGLAVHEPPSISPGGTGMVEEGMIFSLEPGIYLPGRGGVRLEDLVLVTSRGCEMLTYLSKELKDNIVMG